MVKKKSVRLLSLIVYINVNFQDYMGKIVWCYS